MESLKRFCVPYGNLKKLRIYIIVLMALIVFVAYKTINDYLSVNTLILNTVMVFLAFIIGWLLYFTIKRVLFDRQLKLYEKRMKTFKQNGVIDLVIHDFRNGQKTLGGNLIVGQDCLIGRNTGMIAFYDEIQRIYQEAKNTGNYTKAKEGESSSLCVVCDNTNYTLCIITLNELYEREVVQLCKSVNSRNVNFDY